MHLTFFFLVSLKLLTGIILLAHKLVQYSVALQNLLTGLKLFDIEVTDKIANKDILVSGLSSLAAITTLCAMHFSSPKLLKGTFCAQWRGQQRGTANLNSVLISRPINFHSCGANEGIYDHHSSNSSLSNTFELDCQTP